MGDSKHNISEAEKMGIVEYINSEINAVVDPRSDAIFEKTKDGTILARVIDAIKPGTIPIEKLNTDFSSDQKIFKMLQNQQMVLEGAKKLGCNIVNIGGQDLVDGSPHLTMGVLWQVVRVGLLTKVASLFGDSMGMPPEQLLLRWMNYHLTKANYSTVVTNFSSDLQNGEALTYLMNQLSPENCDLGPLAEAELPKRAEAVLQNADKIGCRKIRQRARYS
jgi:plastin-1